MSVIGKTTMRIGVMSGALLALSVVFAGREATGSPEVNAPVASASKAKGDQFGFIENRGQWDPEARYLLNMKGLNMWVTDSGVKYDFQRTTKNPTFDKDGRVMLKPALVSGHVVELQFSGTSSRTTPVGVNVRPGVSNFLRGTGNFKGVQSFEEVRVEDMYPGIDMRSYIDKGSPRYDLIVAPGADPSKVRFQYKGAKSVRLANDNTIRFVTRYGEVQVADLFAYQDLENGRTPVRAKFQQKADGSFGFDLGSYDASKPLVIDPIVYSTVFGGFAPPLTDLGIDGARGVAIDQFNNAYVTGFTNSPNFPATNGAYDNQVSGFDAFVTKFRSDATNLIYSTFIGGSGTDQGLSIKVDTQLRAVVAGATDSAGGGTAVPFPTTPGAPQETYGGGTSDAFVVRLSSDGGSLELGTFLGGTSDPLLPQPPGDLGLGVGLDGGNNIYVVGQAVMPDFPTTANVIQPNFGGSTTDGFAARISVTGFLDYCSFLGGTGGDVATAVVVDNVGYAHVTGNTGSLNFPVTAGSFDTSVQQQDGFICKINPSGTAFDYSTVLGGSSNDAISAITIDNQGNAYVCGSTTSNDFPRTPGCFDDIYNPDFENFVTKLAIDGSQLVYSTFMNGGNVQRGIAVDDLGVAYITGNTAGALVTSANADDASYNGPALPALGDAYVQALDEAGSNLLFGSFYGGRNEDGSFGIAVDASRNAYIVGSTNSDPDNQGNGGFPTTAGVFKETVSVDGNPPFDDGFLVKLKVRSTPILTDITINPSSVAGTESAVATLTLSGPASPGGAVIRLSSANEAVARPVDGGGNLLDLIVIPEGATTANFTISTSDVVTNFVIPIRAELEGDSKAASITVAPWLTNMILSPNTVVGGNRVTGRVNLFRPASAGMTVTISSSDPTKAYAVDAGGTQISSFQVPTGNTTAVFDVLTRGVDVAANVTLLAKISTPNLQVTRSQILRILPASLRSLSFSPNRVNGGEQSTGTVTLDGEAGPTPIRVDLTLGTTGNPPVGVTLPNPPFVMVTRNVNDVMVGQSKSFTVTAGVAAANSFRNIVASRNNTTPVQSRTATLFIDANDMLSVDLDQNGVLGGTVVNGHVTLTTPAASGGFSLRVTTSDPTYAPFTPNKTFVDLTVPAGAIRSPEFTISTKLTRITRNVTITASKNGYANKTATLIVRALDYTLSFNPTTVVGGSVNPTGTIALSEAAGTNGVRFTLSSNNTAALAVPGAVTVPEGQTSIDFTATSRAVRFGTTVTVTASAATLPVPLVKTATVRVNALGILLTVDPTSPVGGTTATGKITLSAPTAGSGILINVVSNNAAVATPAFNPVRVLPGETERTFPINTNAVAANTLVRFTATTPAGVTAIRTINVLALTVRLTINPNFVVGGLQNSTGTVTLGTPAPNNQSVTLTSNNPAAASVPASITMPIGATSRSFPIITSTVAADVWVQIRARLASGVSTTANIRVQAPRFTEFYVVDSPVIGGDNTNARIRLSANAPTGGITINTTSNKPNVASVPSTVTIPAGTNFIQFTVTTFPVSLDQTVTLTAAFSGQTRTAQFEVWAPTVLSLELIPTAVIGGNSFTGKVTIDKVAPAGGITLQLAKDGTSTGSPYVVLPSTVTIPAGSKVGTFTGNTLAVSRSVSSIISASSSQHSQQVTAVLTILPR